MASGGDFDMAVQVHLAKKSGTFDIKKKFLIIRFVYRKSQFNHKAHTDVRTKDYPI